VKEGVTGFVVPPLDPHAMANTVLCLLKDEDLRRNMATQAREHAVEQFDAKICAEAHVKGFESALDYYEKKRKERSLFGIQIG
jgi:glycosyltransferase involved in cell wall biosynthesis